MRIQDQLLKTSGLSIFILATLFFAVSFAALLIVPIWLKAVISGLGILVLTLTTLWTWQCIGRPLLGIKQAAEPRLSAIQKANQTEISRCLNILSIQHSPNTDASAHLLALTQLAQMVRLSPETYPQLVVPLIEFIKQGQTKTELKQHQIPHGAIQNALSLLIHPSARRATQAILPELCLSGLSLSHLDFRGGNLDEANLDQALLENANCLGAHFKFANLNQANLHGAKLYLSNLQLANLFKATLTEADCREANFQEAILWYANLEKANFVGATLWRANLQQASLVGTRLAHADLSFARCEQTDFTGADLESTILYGTDLSQAIGLTQQQLNVAFVDEHTRIPKNLHRPPLERSEPITSPWGELTV